MIEEIDQDPNQEQIEYVREAINESESYLKDAVGILDDRDECRYIGSELDQKYDNAASFFENTNPLWDDLNNELNPEQKYLNEIKRIEQIPDEVRVVTIQFEIDSSHGDAYLDLKAGLDSDGEVKRYFEFRNGNLDISLPHVNNQLRNIEDNLSENHDVERLTDGYIAEKGFPATSVEAANAAD